jgi:hypothetical protein
MPLFPDCSESHFVRLWPFSSLFEQANLLTGLINVSISTIDQGSAEAVGILLVYSAFLYGTVWMYHQTR